MGLTRWNTIYNHVTYAIDFQQWQ